jgi:membrane protein implicated in regulation of membrane protease activity
MVNEVKGGFMGRLIEFFSVLWSLETYRRLAFLLLAFPLGIGYAGLILSGMVLGASLSFVLIGIPILLVTLAALGGLAAFERGLIHTLTDQEVPLPRVARSDNILKMVTSFSTWRTMSYLLLKFPLGLFSLLVVGATTGIPLLLFIGSIISLFGGVGFVNYLIAILLALVWVTLGAHVNNAVVGASIYFARNMLSDVDQTEQQAALAEKAKRAYKLNDEGEIEEDRADEEEVVSLERLIGRRG